MSDYHISSYWPSNTVNNFIIFSKMLFFYKKIKIKTKILIHVEFNFYIPAITTGVFDYVDFAIGNNG